MEKEAKEIDSYSYSETSAKTEQHESTGKFDSERREEQMAVTRVKTIWRDSLLFG